MASETEGPWSKLEQWSPIGFLAAGVGFLIALSLLVLDQVATVTIPELLLATFAIPSFFALTVLALPGFYPYVAQTSPRLALAGVVAAIIAAASLILTTVGKIALHFLGVIGFTEEGPLLAGFFLLLIAFFLSVLFYGLASARTGEPSRIVGLLLLVITVEPAATLLNDLLGVDVALFTAFATLGVAGLAFVAIGYILRGEASSNRRHEPARETAV